MASKPVQVSIDSDLLRRIDRDPETRQKGRSAFIRAAVELYLTAKRRQRVESELREAYDGHGELHTTRARCAAFAGERGVHLARAA